MAILALALAALSYGSAVALRGQARAERLAAAVHQAELVLATIGRTGPLQPGEAVTRLDNGWVQRVAIAPLPIPALAGRRLPSGVLVPYDVRVSVVDRNGQVLTQLASVRLALP